jgi:hypothetical protein
VTLIGFQRLERDSDQQASPIELRQDPSQPRIVTGLVFTVGADDQERGGSCAAGDVDEEITTGGIGPLEIVEQEDQWV